MSGGPKFEYLWQVIYDSEKELIIIASSMFFTTHSHGCKWIISISDIFEDGTKYRKPTPLPANQYITFLMEWIESQVRLNFSEAIR